MEPKQRVVFMDNLRFFFVFCVILQHSGMAYLGFDWWPVKDKMSIVAMCLVGLFDAFLMPSLFFIAGHFAIPTIQKKGAGPFLKGKLNRLGIPWLACILFICPILPLVYHYTRDGMVVTVGYFDRWKAVMGAAVQFDIGLLPPMNQLMQNDGFYQRYMWFVGLLILFFICFGVLYRVKQQWFERDNSDITISTPSVFSTLRLFLSVGFATLAGSMVIIGLVMVVLAPGTKNPETWFTLGNIVQFRISRIFLHTVYFSLGILSYRNRWLERGRFPGHLKTWIVLYLLLAPALLSIGYLKATGPGGPEEMMGMLYWIVLNFMTITSLGLCGTLALKYWHRDSPKSRKLAANSYNLYLAHYPFVIVFQLALLTTPLIPAGVKFSLVSVLAVAAAYITSHFLIRPYPKATLAIMASLFVIMAIGIQA